MSSKTSPASGSKKTSTPVASPKNPSKTAAPSSSQSVCSEAANEANTKANPTPPTTDTSLSVDMSALELSARSKPESHYVSQVHAINDLAEDVFYGRYPDFLSAAKARDLDPKEAASAMAVQLVMTQQLLETRRVPKPTSLLALAKRQDGFSELTMQQAWDQAWDQIAAENQAKREEREAAYLQREKKRAAIIEEARIPNKNGSQKRKEKRAAAATSAPGAAGGNSNAGASDGGKKQTFMNGGVACGPKFNLEKKKKN